MVLHHAHRIAAQTQKNLLKDLTARYNEVFRGFLRPFAVSVLGHWMNICVLVLIWLYVLLFSLFLAGMIDYAVASLF